MGGLIGNTDGLSDLSPTRLGLSPIVIIHGVAARRAQPLVVGRILQGNNVRMDTGFITRLRAQFFGFADSHVPTVAPSQLAVGPL